MLTLQHAFQAQAKETPHQVAVMDDESSLTYAELDHLSNQLAHHLTSNENFDCQSIVGIYLDKRVEYIVACLATLKAGGICLPIEIALPRSQIQPILTETEPQMVFTEPYYEHNLPENIPYWAVDNRWLDAVAEQPATPIEGLYTHNEQIAFLVYSSGTTGQPKGVELPHRSVLSAYNWRYKIADYYPNDRVGCNIFFIWEVFRPLLRGATAYIIKDALLHDIPELLRTLKRQKIIEILMTPSFLETLIDTVDQATLTEYFYPSRCWLNGEPVTHALREKLLRVLPEVQCFNLYSISECHDVAALDLTQASFKSERFNPYCPVGRVMPEAWFQIVDQHAKPVPHGEVGELYIASPGVARGYFKQPKLTARKFKPVEKNMIGKPLYKTGDLARIDRYGQIEIIGRCDFMVKIRGYSVQLKAVEAMLKDALNLQQCAVLTDGGETKDARLIAYLMPRSHDRGRFCQWIDAQTGSSANLKQRLQTYMPHYMIPSVFVLVDAFPHDPISGKIHYDQLPTPPQRVVHSVEGTHHSLEALWCHYLGISFDQVHPEANFFELGGTSLTAIQLVNAIEKSLNIQISIHELLNNPTLNHLQNFVNQQTRNRTLEKNNWDQECALTLSQRPKSKRIALTLLDSQKILLTGVTGFLGAYVLHEVLNQTSAVVYCLIRAENKEQAWRRIQDHLNAHQLWDDRFVHRIEPIIGNLEKPFLGFTPQSYDQLSHEVDQVIHCAAHVNLFYPYTYLKPAIIEGTRTILTFCFHHHTKPLHYLSTSGVFPNTTETFPESSCIEPYPDQLTYGYAQAKWVAERLVWKANHQGLPVAVYRPGNLGTDTEDGPINTRDFNTLMMLESLEIGALPSNWVLEMTPVNWVAKNLITIACHVACQSQVYNMTQSEGLTSSELLQWLPEGVEIETIMDYKTWRARIENAQQLVALLDAHGDVLLHPKARLEQCNYFSRINEFSLTHRLSHHEVVRFFDKCQCLIPV